MRVIDRFILIVISVIAFSVLSGCNQGSSVEPLSTSGVNVSPVPPSEPTAPATLRSATLSWSAPSEKENGDILPSDELMGFYIYYGENNNPFENVILVDSPYATSYTINNLVAGNYTFSIVAVDASGRTSAFSNYITKTIS